MCFIKEQTQNYNEITNVTTPEFFLMLHSAAQTRAKSTRCFPTPGIKSTAWQWTFCSISLCLLMSILLARFLLLWEKSPGMLWGGNFRSNLHETEFPWLIPSRKSILCCWSQHCWSNPPSFTDWIQLINLGHFAEKKNCLFPFWDSSPQTEMLHFHFWNLPLHQIQSKRLLMGFFRG